MKQLLILFIFIAVSCEQQATKEELLTNNPWTIEKVENREIRQVGPDELNKGTRWIFNKDNTFHFEMKNELWDKTNTGTWALTEDSLVLFDGGDTTSFRIEKLTDKDLTCTTVKEDTLTFKLRSLMD